jgi:hypothetical protein
MYLYHRTDRAEIILRNGFKDGKGRYLTSELHRGVWFSNMPLDINEDAKGMYKRALRNDFTVAHNKKLYQIKDNIRTKNVMVEERTDGSMRIMHNGQRLKYKEIKSRPIQEVKKPLLPRVWRGVKPAADHPWKVMKTFARKGKETVSTAA